MPENTGKLLQQGLALHQSGRLQEAESIYQGILREDPEQADAWHLLGVLAHQVGKNELAVQSIEKAIKLNPGEADFHNNCGEAYRALGKFDLAVSYYQQALSIRPGFAGAINNLGNALKDEGKLEDAASRFREALKHEPAFVMARNNLGIVLREQGHAEEALEQFKRVVSEVPQYAEAHNNLGNTLVELERIDDAIASYQSALQQTPNYVDALVNLGMALMQIANYVEARKSIEKAINLEPANAVAHFSLGLVLDESGHPRQAIDAYRKVLELEPAHAACWHNMGFALQELGESDAALEAYQRALEVQADYPAAHLHISMISPASTQTSAIQRQLGQPGTSANDRAQYHFALANFYHAQQEPEQAFSHYQQANRAKRETFRYRASDFSRHVDRLIQVYSSSLFDSFREHANESTRPVFILGLPRSGSTLIEQIISCHESVAGAGELPFMENIEQDIRSEGEDEFSYPDNIVDIEPRKLRQHAQYYLDGLKSRGANSDFVSDKDPGNFHRLGLVRLMFPNAAIIHCERNPLDTCLSIYTNYFAHGNIYSFDLEELGQYYVDYHRLMTYWNQLFAGQILNTSYEDLVNNQEQTSRLIIEHLGLDWDPSCLDFHLNQRAVRTASSVQVRMPMYSNSIERWRSYEKQLQPLSRILANAGIIDDRD